MMRSLYSGVSGLKLHQTRMDVIANNISNVNTVGFKSSRVIFSDIYSQSVQSASEATANNGGTNPMQIGLGVQLAAIDTIHNSAATQRTDNPTDLAIEGDGYFIVQQGTNTFYTRAGNFYVDNIGNLVTAGGDLVMGHSGMREGATEITDEEGNVIGTEGGTWTEPTELTGGVIAELGAINVAGFTGISINEAGEVRGLDSEGEEKVIAHVALAMFSNPSGLEKKGDSLYAVSPNSGAAVHVLARTNGSGKINPGGLEMSNVDLAAEFTDMIITQRGFQANSRVITTTDSLLEELVNLKR
jgi:flagellar hook protein FlgE